jgi:hypothetical protein
VLIKIFICLVKILSGHDKESVRMWKSESKRPEEILLD